MNFYFQLILGAGCLLCKQDCSARFDEGLSPWMLSKGCQGELCGTRYHQDKIQWSSKWNEMLLWLQSYYIKHIIYLCNNRIKVGIVLHQVISQRVTLCATTQRCHEDTSSQYIFIVSCCLESCNSLQFKLGHFQKYPPCTLHKFWQVPEEHSELAPISS